MGAAGARVQKRDDSPPPFVPARVNIPIMFDSNGRYVIGVQMGPSRLNLTMTTGSGMTYVAGNTCSQCSGDGVNLYDQSASTTVQQFGSASNVPFFNGTAAVSMIKENCSLPTSNGSLWVYPNQTSKPHVPMEIDRVDVSTASSYVVAVMNDVSSNIINQASGANIAGGVSGLVGLGTNRGVPPSSSNTTFNPSFGDSIMGQWLGIHPTALNFSFGVALDTPVVTPKPNTVPSSAISAPSTAGTVHWLQPDDTAYDATTLAFAPVNSTQASLQASLATDPQDWVVTLDGWLFVSNGDSINHRQQIVANVDPLYQGIYIPLDQATLIHAAIPGAVSQPTVSTLGSLSQTWKIPCDSVFSMGIIVQSQTYTLDHNTLVIQNGDGTCTSGLEAWTDGSVNQYLLGARFMSSLYLIFNVPRDGSSSIGFANRATQGKSHTGAIVGGTVGGVLGLIIIGLVAWYFFWFRPHSSHSRTVSGSFDEDKTTGTTGNVEPYPVFTPQGQPISAHPASPSSYTSPLRSTTGYSESQTIVYNPSMTGRPDSGLASSPSQIVFVNEAGQIVTPIVSPTSATSLLEIEDGAIAPPAYEEREESQAGSSQQSRRPREKGQRRTEPSSRLCRLNPSITRTYASHPQYPNDQESDNAQHVQENPHDTTPSDAASSHAASQHKAPHGDLSGNPEGVGFVEQVGSHSASAQKGSSSWGQEGFSGQENITPPSFVDAIKNKIGLKTTAGEDKQNRGGGEGVTGSGKPMFDTGKRLLWTSAVLQKDNTKGQAPKESRQPKDKTNADQNDHLQHRSSASKGGKQGKGNAAENPTLPSHQFDDKGSKSKQGPSGARGFATSASLAAEGKSEHTADSYSKDVDSAPPSSAKTHQVDTSATGAKVQPATEPQTGEFAQKGPENKEYETVSKQGQPYDIPPSEGSENDQKLRYGGRLKMVRLSSVLRAGLAWGLLCDLGVVGAMVPLHYIANRAAAPGTAFDRQYVVPTPSTSDNKADWWWMNVQADAGVNGAPPANIQVVFFMGYIFEHDSDAPEFYASVDGFFDDGTPFHLTLPATSATVTQQGDDATGTWDGAGMFVSSPGRSYDITFANDDVQGTISIAVDGAPSHFACNTTSSPFFDSITPSAALTSSQDQVLFEHLGWAVSAPSGRATVALTIDGTPLTFTGTGYHDQNFIDSSDLFADTISEWFFGTAQVGPYVFSYLETRSFDSEFTLSTGFLARDGVVLQNQCRVAPTNASSAVQATDSSKLSRVGVIHSDASDVDVPKSYVVDYVLANGEEFSFTLTETTEVLDIPVYHRSIGPVSGGKVGEPASEGVTLFEWLNPGVNVYITPQ
ncbi:hypothetical protein EIP91_010433 [Steccherinum ochraceum]|uniref:Peptidase A1 domain-containing protein n=1 Tax=Steccherinum ochraceum TaxID=92696 RepID=A0A4R0R0L5_9APHY|nr:hypothetical protein EIP91_010433 [Steccherinum ochraceum]